MLTSYSLPLKNIWCGTPTVGGDNPFGIGHTQVTIGTGTSLSAYSLHGLSDPMDFEPYEFSGVGTTKAEKVFMLFDSVGIATVGTGLTSVGIGTTSGILQDNYEITHIPYKNMMEWKDSVSKAMLIALLDGSGKRTVGIGTSTLSQKADIFFNTLSYWPDYGIKPWIGAGHTESWRNTHSSLTISSVSRSNNIATVTTSSAHGLNDSYDDWGAVITLNNSSISTSFNISTSTYPNGVPITITGSDTFHYKSVGFNTSQTGIGGTADIRIGFGGTSNDFHILMT